MTEVNTDNKAPLEHTKVFFHTGQKRSFDKGDVITNRYTSREKIFWIESGYASASVYTGRGSQRILFIEGPDNIFPIARLAGYEHAYLHYPQDVHFVAMDKVEAYEKSLTEYRAFLAAHPETTNTLVYQQFHLNERLYNASLDSAEQRLAHELLMLANRFGQEEGTHIIADLPITIQTLAETVKLSRETTGRLLSKLEASGHLILSRKHLVVNREKIIELLREGAE